MTTLAIYLYPSLPSVSKEDIFVVEDWDLPCLYLRLGYLLLDVSNGKGRMETCFWFRHPARTWPAINSYVRVTFRLLI